MTRIGIDLGGTKIEAIAMDKAGQILTRHRIVSPPSYTEALKAISQLTSNIETEIGAKARIGIGHPGSISPTTGKIRNANSTWLNDQFFERDIAEKLDRPVRLANDADCFALSEATDGAAKDVRIVFGVILGTGVGGGIVINGQLLTGAQKIAGEWGHNPLPWPQETELPGHPCWCGQTGCIETWLSGPGMARHHLEAQGADLTAQQIFKTDAGSKARYIDRLARALASVINLIDPDIIVLGGGVSNVDGLAEQTQKRLPGHVFSDHVKTRIVKNKHGDSSGVRGAAWLWPAEER